MTNPSPQDYQRNAAQAKRTKKPVKKKQEKTDDKGRSATQELLEIAKAKFFFGVTDRDEPYAVLKDGPNVALLFKGGKHSLRATLANDFFNKAGRAATGSALDDSLLVLQGAASQLPPQRLPIRAARGMDRIVIDLGDVQGRAVEVRDDGWEVLDRSPVLFRRSSLTGPLPVPERGGTLEELRELLNVTEETWPLVVGWLVSCLIEDVPHPILLLGGTQGSGKSTAARLMAGIVDASPAPLRSEPRDAESWAVSAAGSWVVCVDNVSGIPPWWSEALCRCVTGDAWVKRLLYTNSDLAVLSFRRCVMLTSIDVGALRGDLGERLLLIDVEPIPPNKRKCEADLARAYDAIRPRVLGALLDLVSNVLAVLPEVQLDEMPRMADFAKLLAAIDLVLETDSLGLYLGQGERVAQDIIESDPVVHHLAEFLERALNKDPEWCGSAKELLEAITPEPEPARWPKHAQKMQGIVKRAQPALLTLGIEVERGKSGGKRFITFRKRLGAHVSNVPNVPSLESPDDVAPDVGDDQDDPGAAPPPSGNWWTHGA